MALTREQILARKIAGRTEDFTLPDGSGSVVIRGLTRNEALAVRALEDLTERDNLIISFGLVDPVLTPADVGLWGAQDDAGTLTHLSNRLAEISGLAEGAGKSGVPKTRRRS